MNTNRPEKYHKKITLTPNSDLCIESDEYVGFIVGYTSNGAAYGLTHEQWNAIKSDSLET